MSIRAFIIKLLTMASTLSGVNCALSAYEKPPEYLRSIYKTFQKLPLAELEKDKNLIDFSKALEEERMKGFRVARTIDVYMLQSQGFGLANIALADGPSSRFVKAYEHDTLPGLHIVPSLLNADIQWDLISRLLHRDLASESHKTNIHTHYHVPYELAERGTGQSTDAATDDARGRSFFNCHPDSSEVLRPINQGVHKPITIAQFLHRKLRWITLGGQYDWTQKVYPKETPPPFPVDVARLVQAGFPDITPEAAIVNIYTPGDTLSLHRDVSEESDQGLVSISLGCDGIFLLGLDVKANESPQYAAIRLRSGDAVYMSQATRYAWHGVPQIIPNTCPAWLSSWPTCADSSGSSCYESWRGWMSSKRINLNVRQMKS